MMLMMPLIGLPICSTIIDSHVIVEELTTDYRYDFEDAPDWFTNMLDYHR
jgi:hypothetical protein